MCGGFKPKNVPAISLHNLLSVQSEGLRHAQRCVNLDSTTDCCSPHSTTAFTYFSSLAALIKHTLIVRAFSPNCSATGRPTHIAKLCCSLLSVFLRGWDKSDACVIRDGAMAVQDTTLNTPYTHTDKHRLHPSAWLCPPVSLWALNQLVKKLENTEDAQWRQTKRIQTEHGWERQRRSDDQTQGAL